MTNIRIFRSLRVCYLRRKRTIKSSIKSQFQIRVLAFSLIISFITIGAGWVSTYHSSKASSLNEIHEYIAAVQNTLVISAYADNAVIAKEALVILTHNPIICYAQLQTISKSMTVSNGNELCNQGFTEPISSFFDSSKTIATLKIGINYNEIKLRAFRLAVIMSCMIFFVFSATCIALWYATDKIVVSPLLKLVNQVHHISPGSADRLPTMHIKNELGEFVKDINALLATVETTLTEEVAMRVFIEGLQKQYQAIFEHARTGIALIDRSGRWVIANPAVATMLQLDFMADGPFCLPTVALSEFSGNEIFNTLMKTALDTGAVVTGDLPILNPHDAKQKSFWINVSISAHSVLTPGDIIDNSSNNKLLECILIDINERKQHEEEIKYEADHDQLTGLKNRSSGVNCISQYLTTNTTCNGAILLIDLDRFKLINDTYGHAAGDKVLKEVSKRFIHATRPGDIIARLGGDEFLIGLCDISDTKNLEKILKRIIRSIAAPINLGNGVNDYVGASIGVVIVPPVAREIDVNTIIQQADSAMYKVKNAGRCGYCIYYVDGVYSEPYTGLCTVAPKAK